MIIKIAILVALIRLLVATDRPILCSGLYTVSSAPRAGGVPQVAEADAATGVAAAG